VSTRGFLAFNYDVYKSLEELESLQPPASEEEKDSKPPQQVNNNYYGDNAGLVGLICLLVGMVFTFVCLRCYKASNSTITGNDQSFHGDVELGRKANV
jgi:hypothetical protein